MPGPYTVSCDDCDKITADNVTMLRTALSNAAWHNTVKDHEVRVVETDGTVWTLDDKEGWVTNRG